MARRNRFNAWQGVAARELGTNSSHLRQHTQRSALSGMRLSEHKVLEGVFQGGVNWMALDAVEDRYLLAGCTDTTIAAFDMHAAGQDQPGAQPCELQPLFSINRRTNAQAPKFMVSSVTWYPVDTGLFVSGSYDNTVRVWDTNKLVVVNSFSLPAKVSSTAMSAVATSHCLVAASALDPLVRLCDPSSGAITHVFTGHREAVWSVAWSTCSEYEVISGDRCGQVRVWDIRRSGCRCILDQHTTQPQRQVPPDQLLPAPPPKKPKRGSASGSASGAATRAPEYVAPELGLNDTIKKAHGGAVTCVLPCPDGVHLLTAGTDDRMRLWDAHFRNNLLVSYPFAFNRAIRARQLSVTDDAHVVFHPSGSSITLYSVETGDQLHAMQGGHTESVNCCVYNPTQMELYSGANDGQILVWQAHNGQPEDDGEAVLQDRGDTIMR